MGSATAGTAIDEQCHQADQQQRQRRYTSRRKAGDDGATTAPAAAHGRARTAGAACPTGGAAGATRGSTRRAAARATRRSTTTRARHRTTARATRRTAAGATRRAAAGATLALAKRRASRLRRCGTGARQLGRHRRRQAIAGQDRAGPPGAARHLQLVIRRAASVGRGHHRRARRALVDRGRLHRLVAAVHRVALTGTLTGLTDVVLGASNQRIQAGTQGRDIRPTRHRPAQHRDRHRPQHQHHPDEGSHAPMLTRFGSGAEARASPRSRPPGGAAGWQTAGRLQYRRQRWMRPWS